MLNSKNAASPGLWLRRFLCYLCGLFIMAIGVVFSVRSSLGVSPVTCLANVTFQIFGVSKGIAFLTLGACTTLTYCLYILAELLLLRREFKPAMLLQIVASTIFGLLVNLATKVFSFLPVPGSYPLRLVYLFCSIPLVALGVMLYLAPNILPTPGEGLSLAVSKKTGRSVANCKMITDCCMVVCSALVSLLFFRKLVGVREGTVISALLVGFVMKRMMRLCNPWLLRFTGRETKLERAALEETAAAAGAGGVIITISREFGAGGTAIGQKLAALLGIPFYDRELEPLEAAESGLTPEFIRAHEERMSGSVVYDFLTAGYAMYNEDLPPLEKLYAAQTRILRRLAAKGESCVIMGRCGDSILYQQPNSFRVFIHAPLNTRVSRLMRDEGLDAETALARVQRTDLGRARHYRQFAGREWGNTKYYNLAVDSADFGIEGSAQLIAEAVKRWQRSKGIDA